MSVRVGTGLDVAAALAVWTASERAASQPPGAGRSARTGAALRSASALLLVAGEPVVGMLLVEIVERRLEMTMLHVAPDARGAGIARALIAALGERYPSVATWTAQPEIAEALGFVPTGRTRDDEIELLLTR